jgi:hypothetical protein
MSGFISIGCEEVQTLTDHSSKFILRAVPISLPVLRFEPGYAVIRVKYLSNLLSHFM